MRIGEGSFSYEWVENWARLPETPGSRSNGRTHGVAVTESGDVLVFNQSQPGVVRYSNDGRLLSAWGDRFAGAHGLTLVKENGKEYLWLVDESSREVVKTTPDGATVASIAPPPHPMYLGGRKYVPTWVAVNEERFGGNGDVWVADGYGASLVHRYSKSLAYLGTINGSEGGAGAFNSPHGILFRPPTGGGSSNGPELYIADRANRRIQVYDGEGRFIRAVEGACHSPCGFWFEGGLTYVPELFTGIKILDEHDRVVARLGDSDRVMGSFQGPWWPPRCPQGWPNLAGGEHVRPGMFNSPHGIAAAPNGDIFVVEWIVGGRITRLVKR